MATPVVGCREEGKPMSRNGILEIMRAFLIGVCCFAGASAVATNRISSMEPPTGSIIVQDRYIDMKSKAERINRQALEQGCINKEEWTVLEQRRWIVLCHDVDLIGVGRL